MPNPAEKVELFRPTGIVSRRVNRLARLLSDLHERRVSRAAVTYTVAMWIILQVADVAFPLLGIPEWALKRVAGAAVLGFPLAVVIAWIYQVTPNGLVRDRSLRAAAPREKRSERTVNVLLLGFGIVLAFLLLLGISAGQTVERRALERALRDPSLQTTKLEPVCRETGREGRTPSTLAGGKTTGPKRAS